MTSGKILTSSPTTLSGTYGYVYGPPTGTYSVTNLGTIAATGNNFPGAVYLKLGGSLTNGSATATTASVSGYGTNAGVAIVGAPGAVTNFGTIAGGTAGRGVELYDGGTVINGSASDTLAAISGQGFYTAVFINGPTGGIMTKTADTPQPYWLYYFNVDAIGAAAARVKKGGGKVVNGPMEVPGGSWIVQCVDPQGAMFALVAPKK